MIVVVDLNRCQSYGQCAFLAPHVFRFQGEESLEYDHVPADEQRAGVARAEAACPVRAITIGRASEALTGQHTMLDMIAAGEGNR